MQHCGILKSVKPKLSTLHQTVKFMKEGKAKAEKLIEDSCDMIAGCRKVPGIDPRTESRHSEKLVKCKYTCTLFRNETTQSRGPKNTQHTQG